MIINIKDIVNEIDRAWDEPVEAINEMFSHERFNTIKFLSPIEVKMHLTRIGDDIDVSGDFSVDVSYECDRCCDNAKTVIAEKFHLLLMPSKGNEEETENELEDELELSYYSEEEIDLSEYVREQVLLSIPVKLLCDEGCKGLCPNCGANLNREKCRCKNKSLKESPFLKLLKQKQKE